MELYEYERTIDDDRGLITIQSCFGPTQVQNYLCPHFTISDYLGR
jgi:hypothetical protein